MAHFITTKCTGCTMCIRVCPTGAITGDKRETHLIAPELCIDCSTCGIYCPYDAIEDGMGVIVPKIKPKDIPKAYVVDELCSGCVFCVDACPFDCITMVDKKIPGEAGNFQIAWVDQKKCVSCKLCAQVCIKDAIRVERPTVFQNESYLGHQRPEEHVVSLKKLMNMPNSEAIKPYA